MVVTRSGRSMFVKKKRAFIAQPSRKLKVFKSVPSEIKTVDVAVQTNVLSTTAVFTTLNATALGTEIYERIGRRIHLKSIHLRGQIIRNGTAVPVADDYARVMMFYDSEGTTSSISDLLLSYDATGATSSTCFSSVNAGNFERYKVLMDVAYSLPAMSTSGLTTTNQSSNISDYKGEYNLNRFIKLNNLATNYGSGGAINGGGLQLMTISTTAAADSDYSIRWFARVRYSDR